MNDLSATLRYVGACYSHSPFRGKEGPSRLESRVRQAGSASSPEEFLERVAVLMQSENIDPTLLAAALSTMQTPHLSWVRKHPKIAAGVALLSARGDAKFDEACESIGVPDMERVGDRIHATPTYDIPMRVTLRSPLAHGSDEKAGNAMLFRRQSIVAQNGGLVSLPYYAGNAWRGQMRDLLAEDFTRLLGMEPSRDAPPWTPWFFHCLYAGGSLTDIDKTTQKKIGERANATVVLQQRHAFRDMVPMLSLLGVAIGNTLMAGKLDSGDLLPECRETGHEGRSANELLTWEFLTRRDDQEYDRSKNESMIATAEVMMPGTVLIGGCDLRPNVREHEAACLGHGLRLLAQRGKLGGSNRRGWGLVDIAGEFPDPQPYLDYVAERADDIRAYLSDLGAIADAGSPTDG